MFNSSSTHYAGDVTKQDILNALEAHRLGGENGKHFCPIHENPPAGHTPSLSVYEREDGSGGVKCWTGCDWREIRDAIGLPVGDAFNLDMLARRKGLDPDFLRDELAWRDDTRNGRVGIVMPYDEEENVVHWRLANKVFPWEKPDGTPVPLYKRPDFDYSASPDVVLVEGETDAATAWQNDVAAVGVPGATAWDKDELTAFVNAPERRFVYVVREDDAGAGLVNRIAQLPGLWRDRVRVVDLRGGAEGKVDLNEFYLQHRSTFKGRLRSACRLARPLPPPEETLRGDYFEGRTLVVPNLVRDVELGTRIRSDLGGSLYRYDDGVYRHDGEAYVRERALKLLGQAAKRNHVSEIVAFFRNREQFRPLSLEPGERLVRARNGIVDPVAAWKAAEAGEAYFPTPYTPENATTTRLPWDYVPDAECPSIDAFFRQVVHEDAVGFVYELLGYSLIQSNPLRKALLCVGGGSNGKSLLLHLLTSLVGSENFASVPLQRLGGDDRFAPSSLVGKLANICGDIGPRAARDMAVFKQITGGDPIYVERKGRDGYEVTIGAFPVFSANEAPRTSDNTHGYFSRWILLPFPHKFADNSEKEAELKALGYNASEMRGLLRHAVHALGAVLTRGDFNVPTSSLLAAQQYRKSADSVTAYVHDEDVRLGGDERTPKPKVHADYKQFCEEAGLKPLGRNIFYDRLLSVEASIRDVTVNGRDFFAGIGVPGMRVPA